MILRAQHILTRAVAAVLVLCFISGGTIGAQPQPQPVHKVKAAFVFRFAAYVEWPEDDTDVVSTLRIGVVSDDALGDALEEIVEGKSVHGKSIEIERADSPDDVMDCHIVFVRHPANEDFEEELRRFEAGNILTISDSEDFAERGGVITLVENGRRLSIEINVNAAERAQLRISSKLLDLATVVRDKLSEAG